MAKKSTSKKRSNSSSLKKNKSFSKGQLGFFALLFAVVGAFMLAVSLAAPHKPGGGGGKPGSGSGTIDLVMIKDINSDGLPNFGDIVTFNVSATSTSYPWVTLKCLVGGSLVYQQSNGIFPTSLGQNFTLGPSVAWQSGAADCTAT